MLVLSNVCLLVWSVAWACELYELRRRYWADTADVKYELGWIKLGSGIGPMGARPFPSMLFPSAFENYNLPLTVILSLAYASQASLTTYESIYFHHLMRAVRRPNYAKPFLWSNWFYSWIAISLVAGAIQVGTPWMGHMGNLQIQLSKELLTGGVLETA
jgi:hypothetical protein